MYGSEKDAFDKPPVNIMRVKIVHDNEDKEQIELSNINCENAPFPPQTPLTFE